MACYHPLRAVVIGKTKEGKNKLKFLGDNRGLHDDVICDRKYGPGAKIIDIPCGKCIGCRLEYARQWANRCMLEAKNSDHNYFITLTYDNDHVPVNIDYDFDKHKKIGEVLTLRKSDLTKFFKDLRNHYSLNYCFKKSFKYYACGEYGEHTLRPHYHICLFNCKYFDDMQLFYKDKSGFNHYTSAKLEKLWNKGLCEICEFSWQTASYTARYVMKKHIGKDANYYKLMNIEPEFTIMSRRPGIAKDYYIANKDQVYKYDSILVSRENGSYSSKPPRYFDKLFDIDNPDDFKLIKDSREKLMKNRSKIYDTSLNSYEYLDMQEGVKTRQTKSLLRKEL